MAAVYMEKSSLQIWFTRIINNNEIIKSMNI